MAYYSGGSLPGVRALLNTVANLAATHGFVKIDEYDFPAVYNGVQRGFAFIMQAPSGMYIKFYTFVAVGEWRDYNPGPLIRMYLGTQYHRPSFAANGTPKPDNNWNWPYAVQETGDSPAACCTNGLWGPFSAYHLFCGEDYLQIVVEVSPLVYTHFGYVMLVDKWDYVGGDTIYGTQWNYYVSFNSDGSVSYSHRAIGSAHHSTPFGSQRNSHASSAIMRCDVDGVSPNYFQDFHDTYSYWINGRMLGGYPSGSCPFLNSGISQEFSPSDLNGFEVLYPIVNGVKSFDKSRFVGRVPNMRTVNIKNRNPGDVITYGSDEWMVFPLKKKNSYFSNAWYSGDENFTDLSSYYYGLAYKR